MKLDKQRTKGRAIIFLAIYIPFSVPFTRKTTILSERIRFLGERISSRVESPWNNRCEWIVWLQVPSFNGSSYLRYPGLADTSLSWLELAVTLKPTVADGVILYNGHHSDATGDFIALYLSSGHVQFTFDLGTGPASLRWALSPENGILKFTYEP